MCCWSHEKYNNSRLNIFNAKKTIEPCNTHLNTFNTIFLTSICISWYNILTTKLSINVYITNLATYSVVTIVTRNNKFLILH